MQRKVEDWKKSDINKWLTVLHLSKYEECFNAVSGKVRHQALTSHVVNRDHLGLCVQRLLQLSAADIYRFADCKQDADSLLDSLRSLRETGVSTNIKTASTHKELSCVLSLLFLCF